MAWAIGFWCWRLLAYLEFRLAVISPCRLAAEGCTIISVARKYDQQENRRRWRFQVRWRAPLSAAETPRFSGELARHSGVLRRECRR